MARGKYVLGLDTSLSCTGFALLTDSVNPKLAHCGKITTKKDEDLLDDHALLKRYNQIIDKIEKLFEDYNIEKVSIEQPNTSRNMKVTRQLIGLYQIVRYWIFIRHGLVAKEIHTKTIKLTISGNGNAEKQEVVNAVNKLFNTNFIFKKTSNKEDTEDDVCDAIATAYTLIKKNSEINNV